MSINSVLTGNWRKPETTLRCESLYVDGAIDCDTIHARQIVPDPAVNLVCDKLTSNTIENSGNITTKNISYQTQIINQVGEPQPPFTLTPAFRNTIIHFTSIDLAVGATMRFGFNVLGIEDLTNYYFNVSVVNSTNTNNGAGVASIAIIPHIASSLVFVGEKTIGLTNQSALQMEGGVIDVLISWVVPL